MRRESRVLFIVGCSKKKLSNCAPAKDFYQGQLFKMVKKLVTQNNFDYRTLSGKLGLLGPEEMVTPYDHYSEGPTIIYYILTLIRKMLNHNFFFLYVKKIKGNTKYH